MASIPSVGYWPSILPTIDPCMLTARTWKFDFLQFFCLVSNPCFASISDTRVLFPVSSLLIISRIFTLYALFSCVSSSISVNFTDGWTDRFIERHLALYVFLCLCVGMSSWGIWGYEDMGIWGYGKLASGAESLYEICCSFPQNVRTLHALENSIFIRFLFRLLRSSDLEFWTTLS